MMDLVLLTVVGAILGAMLPAAANSGLKKCFSFLAGLALLLSVFRPIANSASTIADLPTRWLDQIIPQQQTLEAEEERTRERVLSYSAQNIEQGVDALIISRYNIPEELVASAAEVIMNTDGQWILKRIVVRLDTTVRCDDEAVAQYIREILACPCVVQRVDGNKNTKGGGTKYGR